MHTYGAIRYYQFGNPADVLQLVYRRIPKPDAGEVLVRMTARPINPSDLIPIRGAYSHRIPLPSIPGYEGVGIIEAIGPSVDPSLLGKRVLPLRSEGTWQERLIASAELVIPVPNDLNDEIASQLYINPVTAWVICTEALRLYPGDFMVVNAGGSSIGRIFAQLSVILGYRLIAITRSSSHTQELLSLGASHVIDTSKPNMPSVREAVLTITEGRGAAAAIDSVGGAEGEELAYSTCTGGTLISIGLLSGIPVHWGEVSRASQTAVQLFWLRNWVREASVGKWHETFGQLIDWVQQNRLRLSGISQRYELAQVKQAVFAAETPARQGKVLLVDACNLTKQ
ncbi:zinc-binding dehydrogenase [Paenibacillus sp. LMG 31456]|uniref:Zinc-binding dehydrogenase n=1 Tax=Paenibacillus foliorum TaxID=2654974 RepID=A0A972GKE8_9BACL|nr:zinc-dependent alcohol dehydrogenase family protein [Paenibacillus foliorum]NOU91640.1 zinc-binding dehydrogenase [Paenibacillus foliorum]